MAENVEAKKEWRGEYSPYTHWLKENVEAIVVAFIAAMVIRCFAVEVFQIPTKSMEPTLMGHITKDESGNVIESLMDRIMVSKFFYEISPIERFDVAVFKFPLNQSRNFIKRVVGMPDEKFFVEGGNIYYRKNDSQDTQYLMAKKPLRIQESIWIVPRGVPEDYLSDRDTFGRYWLSEGTASYSVTDGKLSTGAGAEGRKNIEFRLRQPIRQYDKNNDSDIVGDVKFSCYWHTNEPNGSFYISIENEYGRFYVRLEPSGESRFTYVDIGGKAMSKPIIEKSIRSGRTYEVQLGVFDGVAIVNLDGENIVRYDFSNYYTSRVNMQSNYSISFGSQNSTFLVENIKVWRDIFYKAHTNIKPSGEPTIIPKGNYIMMGDNVADSHDSRGWQIYRFILKDGREAICESQELDKNSNTKDTLGRLYDYVIKYDIHGIGWWFNRSDIVGEEPPPPEPRPFVEEKYIIGKAFLVWWPPSRAIRLIR